MRPAASKDALREALVARRNQLTAHQRASSDATRTDILLSALGNNPGSVALYASRPHEPGTHAAITRLHDAGWRVLLPLVQQQPRWALFTGWEHMRTGWADIPEPAQHSPGSVDLTQADIIVVPCLAVAVDGTRLGTGGGWYDRALPRRRPGAPVWALANANELLDRLPREAHDVPVQRVVTELGSHCCGEAS